MTKAQQLLITACLAVFKMFSMNVADSKGHSQVAWFFAGFLFGPVGLIAVCGLGDNRMRSTPRRIV